MPRLSPGLEDALEAALNYAADRDHEYSTLEHLLLALVGDPSVVRLFDAISVPVNSITNALTTYIDTELTSLVADDLGGRVQPTAAFQRVVQRAILAVESAGKEEVTSANVLLSIYSERESFAFTLLVRMQATRDKIAKLVNSTGSQEIDLPAAHQPLMEYANRMHGRAVEAESKLDEALKRISELEAAIEVLKRSSLSETMDIPDIFVSYQRKDREKVAPLVAALRGDKFNVWWDLDIPAGAPWESTIEKYINLSRIVFVCWSVHGVNSENVKSEARFARDRGKLIQMFLDDTPPPMFFGERQGLAFDEWNGTSDEKCYHELVAHARRLLFEIQQAPQNIHGRIAKK